MRSFSQALNRRASIWVLCLEYSKSLRNIAKMVYFMNWSVEFLNHEVRQELEALPKDIKASFVRISRLIETFGLPKVREPYVKHLDGPLWEMRMKGKDSIARAAYVTATERRAVIVRVFEKKTQKTPRREIELALKRAKDVT
jgi:phage-related protein